MKERKDQRIALMIEPTLVGQIDTYRFSNRIGSQAEAMRVLIRKGLEAEKAATTGDEIGVLAPAEAGNRTRKECCDAADR